MSENTISEIAPQDEIKRLNREILRLNRELRTTKTFLDNATQAMNAKDALGHVLSNTNARQKAYTDMLLESCPNIILLLDSGGNFVLCTKAFLTAVNIPNFDFIKNVNYKEIFSKYIDKLSMDKFEEAIIKVSATHESAMINEWIDFSGKDNKRYYSIEISVGENSENNTSIGSMGLITAFVDLTDFIREKQRAEDASTAKSDFLATMSHEIRTPMNAILGMSEMLGRSELTAEQKKYLSDIRSSSQSLLTIINDILDFSKVEAGRMELVKTNFNLRGLLDNLFSMFSHLYKVKELEFNFEINESTPVNAFGDENRLRQILTNILSNALKYTNSGKVTLSVYLTDTNNLHFAIRDSGIGIREEDRKKLFTPFEQLDLRKNKNVGGTGLGLAISYSLCKIMGGNLWLESVYGEGSTFFIEVPFVESDDNVIEEIIEESEFTASEAAVLVVDDIDINLAVVEVMLGVFEIIPDLVTGGYEAIKSANNKKYDIIFMDHMMPEIDGLATTEIIRKHSNFNKESVIVALTANAVSGMEEMFLSNGFDGFLSKPLELKALGACLRKWLPDELIENEREIVK